MASPPKPPRPSPATLCAQALGEVDPQTRALVPPLHAATTFERDADGEYRSGRAYTRPHNPTYDAPARLLAQLEGGRDCLLFASGMAASTAVFQALLPGDHVVAPRVMYWALRAWLNGFASDWGLDVEFVDTTDLDALAAAMRPGRTRLLWLETPSNPMWDVTDIAAASAIAHRAHARVAVDSTVATPVLTRPLALGADLVVHSATKYLNGHSDVLAGALVCAAEDGYWQRVRAWHRDAGAVLGPFEAWLLLRGMRTLFVRVERCSASALALARHFAGHPQLEVLYPGLAGHPGHAVAAAQMQGGFGGMLSLRHRAGEAAAMATAAGVRVFKRATSLGGVESLIEHRASIEGPSTPVPRDLLRLSIGLESLDDLIADLEQALARPAPEAAAPVATDPSSVATASPATLGERAAVLVSERIRPAVLDRGGDLEYAGCDGQRLTLRVHGSPGAVLPLRQGIESLLRHYLPELQGVDFTATEAPAAQVDPAAGFAARVRHVLAEHVNPVVAAHGGRIDLARIEGDAVYVRLEGRCQGCAMAEVTLRQGVEALLRQHLPGLGAVLDATDHAAGSDPYFRTRKGT